MNDSFTTKVLISLTFVTVAVLAHAFILFSSNSPYSPNPTIKLMRANGSYCTGVVFSNTLAVTAGHCVVNSFGLDPDDRAVFDDEGRDTGIFATPYNFSTSVDLGLVRGDFTKFKKASIQTRGNPFDALIENGTRLKVCGFPSQSRYTECHDFYPEGYYRFEVSGQGRLAPGMSGGPVWAGLFGSTVVAIAAATEANFSIVVPLQGLYSMFNIKEEEN